MKKTFLAFCFVAAGFVVAAQEDTIPVNSNNTMLSMSNNQAYAAAPSSIQLYFTRDYPAVTNVTWTPVNDWWRASYNNNGRYSHVYYNQAGDHYMVALPVTSTWVPDNVISAATGLFGMNIYDITTLKAMDGMEIYHVRLLDNNTLRSEYLDANGNKVTYTWRTDDINSGDMNMNQNADLNENNVIESKTKIKNGEIKTKTEYADGTKVKTETENGKTKTKVKGKKKADMNHEDHDM